VRRFGGFVLQKGAELTPAERAFDERQLANVNAAEANPHRQRDDVQSVEQFVQRWGHDP
jgi:hypothetical protein